MEVVDYNKQVILVHSFTSESSTDDVHLHSLIIKTVRSLTSKKIQSSLKSLMAGEVLSTASVTQLVLQALQRKRIYQLLTSP